MPANSLLLKQTLLSRPLVCVTDTPPFFSPPAVLRSLSGLAGEEEGGGSRFESLAV